MDADNEYQPLIEEKSNLYSSHKTQPQRSSRLDWTSTSCIHWFRLLFWTWVDPIIAIGYKRLLTDDDFPHLSHRDQSSFLLNKLNSYDWNKMSTSQILVRVFWKEYACVGVLLIPYSIVRLAQPLFLRQIVLQLSGGSNPDPDPDRSLMISYLCAVGIGICTCFQAVIHQQYYFHSYRVGLDVRNALTSFIYQRLLSAKIDGFQEMSHARILNLVTNDVTKFEDLFTYGHFLWIAPLESVIVFVLLCQIIGFVSTLMSFVVLVLFVPLQLIFSYLFGRYRQRTMECTDRRVHAFQQFLHAYSTVKMQNWEEAMKNRIISMRQDEFAIIKRTSRLRALNMGLVFGLIPLVTAVTIGSMWLQGRALKAVDIFTVVALFNQIRSPVGYCFPIAIQRWSEVLVTMKRIGNFLKLNKDAAPKRSEPSRPRELNESLLMRNASFSWNPPSPSPSLSALNVDIRSGMFVGICGPVASGKSSLLAAILGEMDLTGGEMHLGNNTRFSYAAQSAWICADTLRANILLGKAMDHQRYETILRACCLDVDVEVLRPSGDLTMIGEKGVNLSGGQRARVSLARALYADADVYLFDDPLASVDRVVAKQIYERCLSPRGLLSDKTRLLVTHQTEYLSECDQTIVLVQGQIEAKGVLNQLSLDHLNIDMKDQQTKEEDEEEKIIVAGMLDAKSIVVDETSHRGTIHWSVWSYLFTSTPVGWMGVCVLAAVLIMGEVLFDGTNYWIALWSRHWQSSAEVMEIFGSVYVVLIVITLVMSIVRAYYCFHLLVTSSNQLHNQMVERLLYTSMRFLESNPSGRILSRACSDQQVLDECLPITFFDAVQTLLMIVGSMVMVSVINPWLLLILLPVLPLLWLVCHYYLRSSGQIKRVESASRSPVYAQVASSMDGLMTIRSFGVMNDFLVSFLEKVDAHTRASIIRLSIGQWFALRTELASILFPFVTALFVIVLSDRMDSSMMALSLMYGLGIAGWLQWGIRQLAEAEQLMISAERLHEYAQLPAEEDQGGKKGLVLTAPTWPRHGRIEFRNYSLSYRAGLEAVLHNISVCIEPGQKIGIIGRTGAGKSSLLQGLLRLVSRSCVQGEILIDGVDISRITLHHLRSHLSVISQQSVLFGDTLRYNLDPFDQYTDEECLMALEDVQLHKLVTDHPGGLRQPVVECGKNLSTGERQLLCIARAILKRSRIVLIDEATADVDRETEAVIRSVMEKRFEDRTVLTIAHRHSSVSMCDRILVLDQGRVVNFDTPDKVLDLQQ